MKILVIHHSGDMGGGTLSCFDIIRAITEKEIDVRLILPPGKNDARILANSIGIKTINNGLNAITFNYYNGGSNLIRVILKYLLMKRYRKQWTDFFEEEKPDLVILNSSVQWPMINILNNLNLKNICFNRETLRGERESLINKVIASNMQRATGVAFISLFDKKQWHLSVNAKQEIIPDMVDKTIFIEKTDKTVYRKKLRLEKDKFYVLYVGGISEFKGARVIIEAMNYVKNENIELIVLGDHGVNIKNSNWINRMKNRKRILFINEINKFIRVNNLTEKIHLLGKQMNMKDWYISTDIVVFPAVKAHQARPIYEAGAYLRPIIVSDFINYEEHIKHEINGLAFKPGDYISLAKGIESLYLNTSLYERLKNNNYKIAKDNHSSEEVNEKIYNFIKEVCD